jgi:hypothetical protein
VLTCDLCYLAVPALPPLQAGGFLPRYIPSVPSSADREDPARTPYGYLCTEKDVILSLDDVQRLLSVLGEELTLRCASAVPRLTRHSPLPRPFHSTPVFLAGTQSVCASCQELDPRVSRDML